LKLFTVIKKKAWLGREEEAEEVLKGRGVDLMVPARPQDQTFLLPHVFSTPHLSLLLRQTHSELPPQDERQ
jgi:hypothetical protein